MPIRSVAWSVGVLTILLAAPANAQEHGQVGLSMGYPASVGIVWQIADRFAVRPEVSLVQSSGVSRSTLTVSITTPFGTQTQTASTQVTTDTTTMGTGISGLIYLWKREALSAFVSPRYAFTRGTNTGTSNGATSPVGDITTRNHFISGSFGAQYALGRRFSVFGEIGLGYNHGSASSPPSSTPSPIGSTTSSSESNNHGVSTRSGVGVVFYFN